MSKVESGLTIKLYRDRCWVTADCTELDLTYKGNNAKIVLQQLGEAIEKWRPDIGYPRPLGLPSLRSEMEKPPA